MKSACVGVLSIIELKNARWNTEKRCKIIFRSSWQNIIFDLSSGNYEDKFQM